jgi:putative nucleotidyltransferase with HDIG domain
VDLVRYPPRPTWIALPALAVLTGSFTFRIPGSVVRLTVAEPIVFTATLLFGPAAGTVAAAIDAIAMSLRMGRHLRTTHRFAFNVALLAVSIWPASSAFFWMTGIDPHNPSYQSLGQFIAPLFFFAAGVFASNSALLAVALSIERGVSAITIWRQQFSWVATSYFASASIAALLVVYGPAIDTALVIVLVPLLVVSYLVFRTTVGRLDDANRHLAEVNSLYLSTIETLAMAIDAKDQVTHGHIRRVQKFAVGLANRIGVDDDRQLRAIEAAALLHDMGKLAIPEFILNKPGRLTQGEFDVMKTHAAVGADILSAIRFPYPVVPIVRHHHENWDGSGYPDGISGTAIPIGARILSVVDCYDALTSDRPYRPAMSDDQAIAILVQRRGSMYDPLVVDSFVRDHEFLKAEVERDISPPPALPRLEVASPPTSDSTSDRNELIASLRLLAALFPVGRPPTLESTAREVMRQLRRVVDFDTAATFIIDDSLLRLRCEAADGSFAGGLNGLEIPVAEQLTGWVAAHRTPAWNSNAALDRVPQMPDGVVIASSIPLSDDFAIHGVLTLYGRSGQDISLSQRRAIECLLPATTLAIARSSHQKGSRIDCTESTVRAAAFVMLDALLSHGHQLRDTPSWQVHLIAFTPVATDRSQTTGSAVAGAAAAVLDAIARRFDSSIALKVTDELWLVCYEDTENDAVSAVMQTHSLERDLQAVEWSVTHISSSQSLQDVTLRLDRASLLQAAPRPRVH